jgi:hypothetical protein
VSLTASSILLSTSLVDNSQTVVLVVERAPGSALLVCLLSLNICRSQLMSSIGLVQAGLAAVVVAAFAEVEADN